jgi:uncharacterized protein UPF0150
MPTKTVVEDYLLAAMKRAEGVRDKNGTLVLTVPDFPGTVASGAEPLECLEDLYRRLEKWVLRSLKQGYPLPPLPVPGGVIDLNSQASRALATYHKESTGPKGADDSVYIGEPDELDAFFKDLDRSE